MYSEMQHHPSYAFQLVASRTLPPYMSMDYTPADQGPGPTGTAAVSGAQRFKYFKRPLIPSLHQISPTVLMAVEPEEPERPARPPTPPTQDVATQSDYRETEAQTDPYTPDYFVPEGTQPELLALASLKWGHGLPPGMQELIFIERARRRRAFEAALPSLDDVDKLGLRKKMMDEMENLEWQEREAEISQLREERLQLFSQALEAKYEASSEAAAIRLEKAQDMQHMATEARLTSVQRQRTKMLRKLTTSRARFSKSLHDKSRQRDVIEDYVNYSSRIYAPILREGRHVDKQAHKYDVDYLLQLGVTDLQRLEDSIPHKAVSVKIKKPPVGRPARSHAGRQQQAIAGVLEKVDQKLRTQKATQETEEEDELAKYRAVPQVVRPATPELGVPIEPEEEHKEMAIVFLQRLLRGRAIQNSMFEGKEKRIELVKELRLVETVADLSTDLHERQKRNLQQHKQKLLEGKIAHIVDHKIGATLEFLSKELVRYKEERRIAAIVMLAERERRMREAVEAGTRHDEETNRNRQDETFRQVMNVHQGTVDSYLEDLVTDSVDKAARMKALQEARLKAATISNLIEGLEEKFNAPDAIVTDLVSSFLLPAVEKADLRTKIKIDQEKYVQAAHQSIYNSLDLDNDTGASGSG